MERWPSESTSPISAHTLAEQALEYLSNAILTGELKTGDRLVERELSETLGISRAPIREALAQLIRQGLAYSTVHRGTFVRVWSKRDLWEVATLRAPLEALAAQLSIANILPADFALLDQIIGQMEDAYHQGNADRLIELDSRFHEIVFQRCRHERLRQVFSDMRLQIRIFRIMTRETDHVAYPDQHRSYLAALRQGDAQTIHSVVHNHIMNTAESALASLADDRTLEVPKLSGSEQRSIQ